MKELLVDLRDAVWSLKKQNKDLRNRLGDALVMAEEQKSEVNVMKTDLDAQALGKEEDYVALRGRLSRLEKELGFYRFLIKCIGVLVLGLACKAWL